MPATVQHKSRAANVAAAERAGRFPISRAVPTAQNMTKFPFELFQRYMKMKESMTTQEKKELLIGLKSCKEEISPQEPMWISENEPQKKFGKPVTFGSGKDRHFHWQVGDEYFARNDIAGGQKSKDGTFVVNFRTGEILPNTPVTEWLTEQLERDVVAKTFTVDRNFKQYVNQNRGLQFAPKETDAIRGFQKVKTPTAQDLFFVKFESTDEFGNNTTTIVKKHQQGNQLCFVAYSLHEPLENPEPETPEKPEAGAKPPMAGKPEKPEAGAKEPMPAGGGMENPPKLKELLDVKEQPKVMVTKTITFQDEIAGADILADFLRKLDL